MRDEHGNDTTPQADQSDLSELSDQAQVPARPGRKGRPGARAAILAGLTLGAATAVVIGQDISTVVSHHLG